MVVGPLLNGDPTRIGNFRLLGRVGAGGMGVVYFGEGADGRHVAVKVLRAELLGDDAFRIRFRREVEAARRIEGPCTPQLIEADADAPLPYFATEYIDGPTLEAYCRENGALERETLLAFAVGVADAVWTIHDAGLIHRDLKPSNILMSASGPKVIDFGITLDESATAITRIGQSIGSPGWMAPEQARGDRVGRQVDVFAWGAVVAFAATGEPPFGTGSADAVAYRVVHQEPMLGHVPDDLLPLVRAALNKDPRRRPDSSEIVRVLLPGEHAPEIADATQLVQRSLDSAWTIAAPTVAIPASVTVEGSRHSNRRMLVMAALLGGLLLLGGAIAWILSQSNDNRPNAATAAKLDSTTTTVPTTTTTVAPPSTTAAPPTTSPPPQPQDGLYVNGQPGNPYYFIAISHPTPGMLTGAVSFLAQDGQTSSVFTFTGPEQNGVATVRPDNGGAPISVTYGPSGLQLGECTQYLEFVQSLSECSFNYSPQGLSG